MENKEYIPILGKTIRLMEVVADGSANGSMAKLAKSLNIAQTSCFRIVKTLVAADWIRPRPDGGYELSFGLLPLLEPLVSYEQLIESVRRPLVEMADVIGLTAKLSVRQGHEAVTIFRAESPRPIAVSGKVGARSPVVDGSSGAVLLSDLDETEIARIFRRMPSNSQIPVSPEILHERMAEFRETGVCSDFGGFHPQINAMSTGLRDHNKQIIAAITIIGLPSDFDEASIKKYRRFLLATAKGRFVSSEQAAFHIGRYEGSSERREKAALTT